MLKCLVASLVVCLPMTVFAGKSIVPVATNAPIHDALVTCKMVEKELDFISFAVNASGDLQFEINPDYPQGAKYYLYKNLKTAVSDHAISFTGDILLPGASYHVNSHIPLHRASQQTMFETLVECE